MTPPSNVIAFPARWESREEIEARGLVNAERERLARELHDVISYGFATISVNAGAALEVLIQEPEQAAEALTSIKTASKEAMHELRAILRTLRGVEDYRMSAEPGLGRLEALVASTNAAGVPTDACIVGLRRPLPVAVDIAAFRIVQEALTNVLRHAGRAAVSVKVTYERDGVVVEVEDDGDGVASASRDSEGSGHGITGMRERVRALGGELEVGPRADRGFRVRARFPVLGRP
jgi:signal transduction histidine kinase